MGLIMIEPYFENLGLSHIEGRSNKKYNTKRIADVSLLLIAATLKIKITC